MFPNHSNDLHTFWASQNHEWTYCYPLGKGNINYFMGGILKHTLILLNSLPNVKLEVKQKIEYRFPKSHLSTFNTVTPNLSRNEYLWFISGTSRFWWGWKFSNKKKKGSREEFKKNWNKYKPNQTSLQPQPWFKLRTSLYNNFFKANQYLHKNMWCDIDFL